MSPAPGRICKRDTPEAAQEIQGLPAVDAATAADEAAVTAPTATAGSGGISRSGFLDHIDACVRYLAAWLGGANDPSNDMPAERSHHDR